ncbi:Fcf2 pre-rRNA processing family protein [Cryptosporidium meleagridis]|uniref:Fcf2 pre-rRNA processing family protein n=1 Tax=Cryptosporidium meleagridis TaxID=93969 RepID=A0A2P4Z443_9CRYT|nr:Fcf2 pre-rRNA processing family protein [Cryptosporidium meleagridis]
MSRLDKEFSSITLPLGFNDIYLSSFGSNEFDTQKPSGIIEIGKHELIFERQSEVPKYKLESDLAGSFSNNLKMGGSKSDKKPNLSSWHNFHDHEKTEQDNFELMALQLRNSIAPGRFYKSENLIKKQIKFNFGVVIDGNKMKTGLSDDSSTYRSNKKISGMSLVHELINNSETQRWTNKKYSEIQKTKFKGGKKWYRKQVLKRNRY